MLGHILLLPVKAPGWVGEQAGTSGPVAEKDACYRMLMKQPRFWVLADTDAGRGGPRSAPIPSLVLHLLFEELHEPVEKPLRLLA